MVLFMLMLCHVCDPPVTHVRTIAICVCVCWTCCAMYVMHMWAMPVHIVLALSSWWPKLHHLHSSWLPESLGLAMRTSMMSSLLAMCM